MCCSEKFRGGAIKAGGGMEAGMYGRLWAVLALESRGLESTDKAIRKISISPHSRYEISAHRQDWKKAASEAVPRSGHCAQKSCYSQCCLIEAVAAEVLGRTSVVQLKTAGAIAETFDIQCK